MNRNTSSFLRCAFLCLATASAARANVYTVTTNADSGPGSLRQAIADANGHFGADTVEFAMDFVASPIVLASPLTITDNLTIHGPGAGRLTISGGGVTGVFINQRSVVTIHALTIADGKAYGQVFRGGGVYNDGRGGGNAILTIANCTLTGNKAFFGGGIGNDASSNGNTTLCISNCTISGNEALVSGGGVSNDASGNGNATMSIHNGILSGNKATFDGGAVVNTGGFSGAATLTITHSALSGNEAGNWGGGVFNNGRGGRFGGGYTVLTISHSTVSGNSSVNEGGGVFNDGSENGNAMLTLSHSTVSGNYSGKTGGGVFNTGYVGGTGVLIVSNSTLSGNVAAFYGGGMFNNGARGGNATMSIGNCTLSGNAATYFGGGVVNYAPLGAATLTTSHTLWVNGDLRGNYTEINAAHYSLGYNIADDGSLTLSETGDQANVSSLSGYLGDLADNGGPTQTHALLRLVGNPAINAGDPDFDDSVLLFDQRGDSFRRIAGPAIDIGAFELPALSPEEGVAGLTDAVGSLPIHDGLQSALTAKLNDALRALTSDGAGTACELLQAFINQCTAQSGKKLSEEDAADLIQEAEFIREQLGGS